MKFLSDILQIIIYQMPPSWNLCLYSFRRKNFTKIKKKHYCHLKQIWPHDTKTQLLRLFLSRHGSPCGYRTLMHHTWDVSWPEWLNPANTSEYCFDMHRLLKNQHIFYSIFQRKSWFSLKLLAKNLWNFYQIYFE